METKQKRKGLNISSRNSRGITVIALTITIIVLLILAGVSLGTISGDDGILNKATEAKKENEEAEEDELRRLTVIEAAANLEETTYKDNSTENEKIVKIPAKCAVSHVEGENTLEDGLVIIDVNGNEWVWIEVPEEITSEANSSEEIFNSLNDYALDYRLTFNTDVWYNGCGLSEGEYNALKDKCYIA